MSDEPNVVVSDTDEMTIAGGSSTDKARMLRDYRATDVPLSAAEIEERRRLGREAHQPAGQWVPRTTANIHDMVPLPEADNAAGPIDKSA